MADWCNSCLLIVTTCQASKAAVLVAVGQDGQGVGYGSEILVCDRGTVVWAADSEAGDLAAVGVGSGSGGTNL